MAVVAQLVRQWLDSHRAANCALAGPDSQAPVILNSNNLAMHAMMDQSEKSPPDKPWAILGISRRQYDTAKPWKKAKMSKEEFAKLVSMVPPEAIKRLKDVADAEVLLEAAFGKSFNDENS